VREERRLRVVEKSVEEHIRAESGRGDRGVEKTA
jgi:hypothetical protein